MQEFATLYVNYIEPSLKVFIMIVVVLGILAFWAQVKEGKLLDLSTKAFQATLEYSYKAVFLTGLGTWIAIRGIGRGITTVFVSVRDFIASRI